MSDISFVRTEMLPPKDPPASEVGVVGWARANLFSGWFNSILTVVSLYFVIKILIGLIGWAWVPTWSATSLPECRVIFEELGRSGHNAGACWGVIAERWPQLLFGFYPNGYEEGTADLRWRPVLAFVLLFVALAPVLFSDKVPAKLIYFTAVYPFLMPWLLWGGTVWTPVSAALGFVLGYVVYKALAQSASELIGLIVGVVAAFVWWLFVASLFSSALASVVPLALEPVESRQFGGFMLSITIGVVAIGLSLPIGIVLALGRQSDLLIVKTLCVGFIEFIRGVPLITLLFVASTLLNIFMPPGTNFDIIMRVFIMVTLFASAYMAEVIRGGLAALPKGQYEGADSLGLNYWQAQRLIIMPQALKISIPGIVSTFIGVFKDTTLVSVIGLFDPLNLTNAIRADADWNGLVWELYGFIALLFFVFCFGMSRYSMYLERKLQTGHR
ncbi:amino acid ABC transporter permease [Epibacterium sp. DP7N7-1]|uniref:amino acid ABC transporter permease n=1 Tax=Tritonibacter mobilis TaxID=379347 RepID=UPI000806AFDD|nr:amino acid ABC transporter permease [Tritonibacter mobilis]MBW3245569.1 amino acid ABC transporter permease [Epibacterium sp. DP7N7-1]MCA2007783.1 amino acid ABC transporter permease [Tritonibacter mobilis]MEE2809322.1 amino acid ABC transporter permease [Pseudomonadota bacterium]NKX76011.1 amino acid ABC transporter permease [Rhodobacteraceae bacterium R_SAG3]